MPPTPEMFQPAKYSFEELQFLLDHLEETPNVALYGDVPKGVNPEAIKGALGRFAELSELEKVRKVPWAGYPPIRSSITRYLAYQQKCLSLQQQGEPRHPSVMTFDSMGGMHRGGVGSDASDMVRTELLENGDRIPFGVQLVGIARPSRVWGRRQAATPAAPAAVAVIDEIAHDETKGTLTCTICDKVVVAYDVAKGSRERNRAMAAARTHCLKTRTEESRHHAIADVPVL